MFLARRGGIHVPHTCQKHIYHTSERTSMETEIDRHAWIERERKTVK